MVSLAIEGKSFNYFLLHTCRLTSSPGKPLKALIFFDMNKSDINLTVDWLSPNAL